VSSRKALLHGERPSPQTSDAISGALTYDFVVLQNRRTINLLCALACAGLMGYALYAQHGLGLEPCPLCIFQRVGIIAMGVVFLAAALHDPKRWGAWVYTVLIALSSLATIGVAARHVYVQSLPPGSVPSCGAPLDVMLKFTPLTEVVRQVLVGGGECQEVNWSFLGLSMPVWVLIAAVIVGGIGLAANLLPSRRMARTAWG
jgi:protein dithiol:quinone oxidoreductase